MFGPKHNCETLKEGKTQDEAYSLASFPFSLPFASVSLFAFLSIDARVGCTQPSVASHRIKDMSMCSEGVFAKLLHDEHHSTKVERVVARKRGRSTSLLLDIRLRCLPTRSPSRLSLGVALSSCSQIRGHLRSISLHAFLLITSTPSPDQMRRALLTQRRSPRISRISCVTSVTTFSRNGQSFLCPMGQCTLNPNCSNVQSSDMRS